MQVHVVSARAALLSAQSRLHRCYMALATRARTHKRLFALSGHVMHQSIARAAAAHGREERAVASSTWPLITPNASLHATEQADSLACTTM